VDRFHTENYRLKNDDSQIRHQKIFSGAGILMLMQAVGAAPFLPLNGLAQQKAMVLGSCINPFAYYLRLAI
jgi:hypothetical protein